MKAADDDTKGNAVVAGVMKVWMALGGSNIDYRASAERPVQELPQNEQQVSEPDTAMAPPPDLSILRDAFDRLSLLLQGDEPLTPQEARSFESLHLLVVSELVVQAKDARPFFSLQGSNLTLPSAHIAALQFIHQSRTSSAGPLSSALKWIPKKLGLNSLISKLARDPTAAGPQLRTDREVQGLCRDIERACSETLALAGTWRILSDDATRSDYLEAMRPMLEHTPIKSRHRSILAIARHFRQPAAAGGVMGPLLPSVTSGPSHVACVHACLDDGLESAPPTIHHLCARRAASPAATPHPAPRNRRYAQIIFLQALNACHRAVWKTHFPRDLTCASWPARSALPFLVAVGRHDALAAAQVGWCSFWCHSGRLTERCRKSCISSLGPGWLCGYLRAARVFELTLCLLCAGSSAEAENLGMPGK